MRDFLAAALLLARDTMDSQTGFKGHLKPLHDALLQRFKVCVRACTREWRSPRVTLPRGHTPRSGPHSGQQLPA